MDNDKIVASVKAAVEAGSFDWRALLKELIPVLLPFFLKLLDKQDGPTA